MYNGYFALCSRVKYRCTNENHLDGRSLPGRYNEDRKHAGGGIPQPIQRPQGTEGECFQKLVHEPDVLIVKEGPDNRDDHHGGDDRTKIDGTEKVPSFQFLIDQQCQQQCHSPLQRYNYQRKEEVVEKGVQKGWIRGQYHEAVIGQVNRRPVLHFKILMSLLWIVVKGAEG